MPESSGARTFMQFLRVPILFYKLMGHDLYAHRSTNKLRNLAFNVYYFLGYFSYNLNLFGEIIYFCIAIRSRETLLEATNAASCICFCFVANFKQIALAVNKKIYNAHMDQLETMFPGTEAQQRDYKLPMYERRMRRIMIMFAWLSLAFTSTFSFYPLIRSSVRYYLWGVPEYERILGFYIWYPYNVTGTWTAYWLSYISQMHAASVAGTAFLSGDLLLVASATQLCMHFEHISESLLQLMERRGCPSVKRIAGASEAKELTDAQRLNVLKILIRRQSICLQLSEDLNTIFSLSLLLNFLIASFTICFIGFQMIAATTEEILKFGVFLSASMVQVLVVCYYGNELIEASTRVGDAAYNQNWFDCSEEYKHMLIFMIARSQKPASIRAPTFPPISFRTYMKVISMSYQFFALLRTTYYGDSGRQ